MALRIAYGRIAQETNALSPLSTTLADFRRTHFVEGAELAAVCEPGVFEAKGFLKEAELSGFVKGVRRAAGDGAKLIPLFSAWAVPGGRLSGATVTELRERLERELRAQLPLDGLYLCLHGAMSAEGDPDPEAGILELAREIVGPKTKIAVSYDLHGVMTPRKMAHVDVVTAYRTNPHRDHALTGQRTGDLLVRTVRGEIRPVIRWRSLPMVIGGGTNVDFLPTMRPIYRAMSRWEKDKKVLYVSQFNAQLWHDHPELGWASVVMTDGDGALADRLADELADKLWAVKDVMPPVAPTASEAIAKARKAGWRRRFGAVCISDASDLVGAGATGDNTRLLAALQAEAQGLLCYVPLRDEQTVEALWGLAEGSPVDAAMGGRVNPALNAPVRVVGRILTRRSTEAFGRIVVVASGDLRVVLTEGPPLVVKPEFFSDLGLDPWKADILVVKSLFPWRLYFWKHNRLTVYARTEGITDFDAWKKMTFAHPTHPRDALSDWRAQDRRRRGV
jgi:microcystin degradation protein MlrC